MPRGDVARSQAGIRTCRRQLLNLVGAAIALRSGHRSREVAYILARQACQALGARQAVASVAGAGEGAGAPFRAVAGDARILSGEHLRLLERAEGGEIPGSESLVDPTRRAVVAVAASINDRGGRPVGALMVADGYSGAFREDDVAVLVALAHIASLTLDNIRLQESVQAVGALRSDAVGGAAGGVAYEFIDLLTVILGHAALLDATLPGSDVRREDVSAIVAAAERASRLTARLLTAGRD